MSDIKENETGHTGSTPDLSALSSVLSSIRSENANSESGMGDVLSGLLSDPEMLAKLPAMIETVKPMLQNLSSPPKEKKESPRTEHDRRAALLLALKPYLSPHRCEAVDYIVKISGITKLLR